MKREQKINVKKVVNYWLKAAEYDIKMVETYIKNYV
jgi:hypothetical protein